MANSMVQAVNFSAYHGDHDEMYSLDAVTHIHDAFSSILSEMPPSQVDGKKHSHQFEIEQGSTHEVSPLWWSQVTKTVQSYIGKNTDHQ